MLELKMLPVEALMRSLIASGDFSSAVQVHT